MSELYTLVERVRRDGERLALTRLSLQFIVECAREGLTLDEVTPTTTCSPELLDKLRAAVAELVSQSHA